MSSSEFARLAYSQSSSFPTALLFTEVSAPTFASNFRLLLEGNNISDVRYGLLVILALSSLTVYGLIIAG